MIDQIFSIRLQYFIHSPVLRLGLKGKLMSKLHASIKMSVVMTLVCLIGILTGCVSSQKVVAYPAMVNHSINNIKKLNQPKIALILGSGGARGYAHIGVIQVLEQRGLKPDFIVGSSAGSVVGAVYASGKTAEQVEKIAMELKPSDVRDFTLSLQGFFNGEKIQNYINGLVDNKPLEQLAIPMYVVATELQQGQQVVFNQGNTGQAVRASTTIPSMFIPTKIGDAEYVDGGLVSPLPVLVAKELGADFIIAVDILARPQYTETAHIWGLFNQNINVMQNQLAKNEAQWADVLIQPDIREKAHIFSTKSRAETIEAGRVAARLQMEKIDQLLLKRQNLALVSSVQ